MKVKNKKTLVAIIAVVLIALVGATIAYFQSSASFENVFNTGTYKVVTTEVFESPDNWKPGEEIPKAITTTNEGTIDAAVRVSYTEKWEDEEGNDITSQIAAGTAIINLDNQNDWTKEGNYYYYNYILKPTESTSSFIKSVTLNSNIGSDVTCTTSQDGLTKTCESTNPALGATYKLTITKETVQADRYQEVWNTNISITEKEPAITVISGTKGNLQPGDIIGIGETEDFYVLSSDNSQNGKTILLAKYSLLVGNTVERDSVAGIVPTTTPGYGLQSVEATGYGTGDSWKGSITFSDENYWMDGNELKSKYNPNNEIYLNTTQDKWHWKLEYRSDNSDAYPYIYDENSNIYPYISGENGYVNKLIEMGAPSSTTGRLLSHEEIVAYENVTSNGTSILSNGLSYWTGYATGDDEVNAVYFDSNDTYIEKSYNTNDRDYCIRPVIEIPTSAIK